MVVKLRAATALTVRFPALAGVDLDVTRGEVVVLRGANGAGKSTLLRLCAGLMRLESGTAEVLGCDLAVNRTAVRGRVGLLGHDTALYRDLTAAENLGLWARAARVDADGVPAALQRLAVARRLWDVPAVRLSAGQRRRVALAAVLLRRPELWLLDEPCAGLDRDGRVLVDGIIAEAAASGATVLTASHRDEVPAGLGDTARTLTMAGGTVLGGVG